MDDIIDEKPIEKLYQVFVIEKSTDKALHSSLVVSYTEIEAIKKAGIEFNAMNHRIFIRCAGYEYRPDIMTNNLIKYKDTIKSASCFDSLTQIAAINTKLGIKE